MYLTAHLVRSPNGAEGINAFRHVHGSDFPWPEDPSRLPETNPGDLADTRASIPQGGNRVRSYLDVLAPDPTPREDVVAALDLLQANLSEQPNPVVFRVGRIALVFGHEFGLAPLRQETFADLRAAVDDLVPQ